MITPSGVTVSNQNDLIAALANLQGPSTIYLMPGNYGDINLRSNFYDLSFDFPVMIVSADVDNPATIERLNIRNASNITIDGVSFDSSAFFDKAGTIRSDGTIQHLDVVRMDDCDNITIRNSTFVGPTIPLGSNNAMSGFAHGIGLNGSNLQHFTFESNELTNLFKGMSIGGLDEAYIHDNVIHDYRSDGIYVDGGQNLFIERNTIYDVRPYVLAQGKGDHPDFMQISNVTGGRISDNLLDAGLNGGSSQGIFGRFDKDIIIDNNIIITRMLNGIYIPGLTDSTISNNLILKSPSPGFTLMGQDGIPLRDDTPQMRVDASYSNVEVIGNYAQGMSSAFGSLSDGVHLISSNNSFADPAVVLPSSIPRAGTASDSQSGLSRFNLLAAYKDALVGHGTIDLSRFDYLAPPAPAYSSPVLNDDRIFVDEDRTSGDLTTLLLANDVLNGTIARIEEVGTLGTLGTVTFDPLTQTLVYSSDADVFDTLTAGQSLDDTFTYTVVDNLGRRQVGIVTVTVAGTSDEHTINGTRFADDLQGGAGEDQLFGGYGNDVLNGGDGHDFLWGEAGKDVLLGGTGNDVLAGGALADRLTGGAGRDVFVFRTNDGHDVITDFTLNEDRLEFLEGIDILRSRVSDYDGDGKNDLTIFLNGGTTITLLGVEDAGSVEMHFSGAAPSPSDLHFEYKDGLISPSFDPGSNMLANFPDHISGMPLVQIADMSQIIA